MITAIATFRPPRRLTIDEAKAIFQAPRRGTSRSPG